MESEIRYLAQPKITNNSFLYYPIGMFQRNLTFHLFKRLKLSQITAVAMATLRDSAAPKAGMVSF